MPEQAYFAEFRAHLETPVSIDPHFNIHQSTHELSRLDTMASVAPIHHVNDGHSASSSLSVRSTASLSAHAASLSVGTASASASGTTRTVPQVISVGTVPEGVQHARDQIVSLSVILVRLMAYPTYLIGRVAHYFFRAMVTVSVNGARGLSMATAGAFRMATWPVHTFWKLFSATYHGVVAPVFFFGLLASGIGILAGLFLGACVLAVQSMIPAVKDSEVRTPVVNASNNSSAKNLPLPGTSALPVGATKPVPKGTVSPAHSSFSSVHDIHAHQQQQRLNMQRAYGDLEERSFQTREFRMSGYRTSANANLRQATPKQGNQAQKQPYSHVLNVYPRTVTPALKGKDGLMNGTTTVNTLSPPYYPRSPLSSPPIERQQLFASGEFGLDMFRYEDEDGYFSGSSSVTSSRRPSIVSRQVIDEEGEPDQTATSTTTTTEVNASPSTSPATSGGNSRYSSSTNLQALERLMEQQQGKEGTISHKTNQTGNLSRYKIFKNTTSPSRSPDEGSPQLSPRPTTVKIVDTNARHSHRQPRRSLSATSRTPLVGTTN